jgi:hypothetical protein
MSCITLDYPCKLNSFITYFHPFWMITSIQKDMWKDWQEQIYSWDHLTFQTKHCHFLLNQLTNY